MTTDSLLPSNSTPLERALEHAMRPDADVLAGVAAVRTAKEDAPDDWLPWLIWEYSLDELLPYINDQRFVLENGLQWQKIRGTPASVNMAFGWIGLLTAIEQEDPDSAHWFEFQLWPRADEGKMTDEDGSPLLYEDGSPIAYETNPCFVPDRTQLANMVGLARLSSPIGTRLSRLHNCYDLRHGRYDEFSYDDGSLYDADSGVWDEDLGVKLSFGRTTALYSYNDDWMPESTIVVTRQGAGYGIGRSLLIADGGSISNGDVLANGTRIEVPQFSPVITHLDALTEGYGWGETVWEDRDWSTPA